MKFQLSVVNGFYSPREHHQVEILKSLGFQFQPLLGEMSRQYNVCVDRELLPTIEIHTLEELMALVRKVQCEVIVDESEIRIYNGHE
jgi:hypothetical protein